MLIAGAVSWCIVSALRELTRWQILRRLISIQDLYKLVNEKELDTGGKQTFLQ